MDSQSVDALQRELSSPPVLAIDPEHSNPLTGTGFNGKNIAKRNGRSALEVGKRKANDERTDHPKLAEKKCKTVATTQSFTVTCRDCGLRLADRASWIDHCASDHNKIMSFLCHHLDCNAAFETRHYLQKHMVIHSRKKIYCCIDCNYSSVHSRNVNDHYLKSHKQDGESKKRYWTCDKVPK